MNEQNVENIISATETVTESPATAKPKSSKKKLVIWGIIVVAVIAIAFAFTYKPKFAKVQSECLSIAGYIKGDDNYFVLDTCPNHLENSDEITKALLLPDTQKRTLEAIQHANEGLGFNASVYSRMLDTTSLMGRQREENSKYKVSWTYHPDKGLEVTYEKK